AFFVFWVFAVKQCLFCDKTKLTREHLFPDWLVELYKTWPSAPGQYKAVMHKWDGAIDRWEQPTITQRKQLMCGPCNNVTIGSIEHEVKRVLIPLIERGASVKTIGRAEQLHIAT